MAKRKKPGKHLTPAPKGRPAPTTPAKLLDDLRSLIRQTREGVAQGVNSALVLLYWQIGHRIRTEILQEKRADYGEEVIPTLAIQLTEEFGNGFSRPNLFRMLRIAEVFPDHQIVSTLSRQLSWSHFVEIIPFKNELQRDFYADVPDRAMDRTYLAAEDRWHALRAHRSLQKARRAGQEGTRGPAPGRHAHA
jgi:hypothetical protein